MRKVLFILISLPLGLFAQQQTGRIDKMLTIFNDVVRQLDMNYVDTLNYEEMAETAINQMLRKVDPYTVYFPKQKDDDLRMLTTGKYGGIGAIIALREASGKGKDSTYIIISNPYHGQPAQQNDVLAGDIILSVDGVSVRNKQVADVSKLLRGVPGSFIKLELLRDGKTIVREFDRAEIHLEPVNYYTCIGDIAYIVFSEFTEGSAKDFKAALDELVNSNSVKGLVIDLRGNGGGIIDEAIQIVSNFVPKGTTVVSTRGKISVSNNTYSTSSEPSYPDLPVVVLVDKNSASASEIVSGSLQDLHRATIVGQRTFGKGLVQNVRPIAYDGHLKVTTSKYYLPSGRCIQAIDYNEVHKGKKVEKDTAGGILPDIIINDSSKVDITYSLYVKHMFFDYSVRYHRTHEMINLPKDFVLTDDDIADFCKFLEEQHFTYETETSKYFDDMLEIAKMEDIDSTTLAALKALEPKLKPSFQEAIQRNIDEIREYLGAEIVERYYFQKGRIAYQLRFDDELKRALEVFVTN